jgi:outer membrane protein assembly factor BamD (BamD/ComL family)
MNNPEAQHINTIDVNAATRGLLLRMGHTWFEQDDLRQAIDIYIKLIEEYPGSEESEVAQSKLMGISRQYEQEGLLRLSLAILERLEQIM